jgi:hypothetical protein
MYNYRDNVIMQPFQRLLQEEGQQPLCKMCILTIDMHNYICNFFHVQFFDSLCNESNNLVNEFNIFYNG